MTKEQLIKEITEGLKEKGLPLAEDAIQSVLLVLSEVTVKYIEQSESKVDDMALPIVKILFGLADKAADKIDGVEEKKA